MNFSGDPAAGQQDGAQTTAAGWGSGTIASGHAQGAFLAGSRNPTTGTFGRRIVAAASGKVAGYDDFTLPFVFASDSGGSCSINFWRYSQPPSLNTLYTSPAQVDTATTYVIDPAAACAPGMALAVAPIEDMAQPADSKAAVVAITPYQAVLAGTVAQAALYIPAASPTLDTFTKIDITTLLQQAGVAFHAGTPIALSDVDGDGRADLLVASSHGSVNELLVFYAEPPPAVNYTFSSGQVLIADLGFYPPFAAANAALTGGQACANKNGTVVSAGATGIVRQDIDGDGIADIVVASLTESAMHLFYGTSRTTFRRGIDVPTPQNAGTAVVLGGELTGDAYADMVSMKSGWGCQGKSGDARLLRNDGAGNFANINQGFPAPYTNIDWIAPVKTVADRAAGASAWYRRNTGLIYGKRTDDGEYTLWSNYPSASYYTTTSTVVSQSLTRNVSNLGNLVDVTIAGYSATTPGQTAIDLYVSADDGVHWEPVDASERTGGRPHKFLSYGQDLRWKATFRAPAATLSGSNALYAPAATSTARLQGLNLRYSYAPPQRISRSKVAYAQAVDGVSGSERAFVASFDTPSMEGHVLSFGLGNVASDDSLSTVNTGALDGGARVRLRGNRTRTVYASQPTTQVSKDSMVGRALRRIPFTISELTSSANTPTLQVQLGLGEKDRDNRMQLLRGGVDPNALPAAGQGGVKNSSVAILRDPGRGTPTPWVSPAQDPNYMGAGYESFQRSQPRSSSQLLMGANDGMLHQFSALRTMNEDWALMPPNVLGRVGQQMAYDGAGNMRYAHQTTADGPTTIAEAYAQDTGWRIVAISGQGQGTDATGVNAYFAVDITDRDDPKPLWQFSEGRGGGSKACNPDPCANQRCSYPGYVDSSQCFAQNQTYRGEMALNQFNTYGSSNVQFALLEAEHFDASTPGSNPAGVVWTVQDGNTAATAAARNAAYVTTNQPTSTCAGTDLASLQKCAQVTYSIFTEPDAAGTYYPLFRILNAPGRTKFAYAIDNVFQRAGSLPTTGAPENGWQWVYGPALYVGERAHQLTLFAQDGNFAIDAVAFQRVVAPLPAEAYETHTRECVRLSSSVVCQPECLPTPDTQEWPSCGVGAQQKCCAQASDPTVGYCQDVAISCNSPASNSGYGLSAPAVGRIRTGAGDRWVAFFASGEGSAPGLANVGRSVYMVDALKGTPMASWNFSLTGASFPDINPAIPAGVSLVDADSDGYVDRLYVGDLAGRMWKINTSPPAALNGSGVMTNPNQFASCVLFDAGRPNGSGARQWAPISSKAAVAVIDPTHPNVYFGTGGHARAPDNVAYAFYSVRDTDAMGECRSTPRTATSLDQGLLEWTVTEPAGSGMFWSEPVIVDGRSVYFTSTNGDPDAIDPCLAANASAHVYGVATRHFTDLSGRSYQAGQSVLANGAAYYSTAASVRTGMVVRGQVASQVARQVSTAAAPKTDVLFQTTTGDVMRLGTVGAGADSPKRLRVVRIREIIAK